MQRTPLTCLMTVMIVAFGAVPTLAQKNSGPLLPIEPYPQPRAPLPPPRYAPPLQPSSPSPSYRAPATGNNPAVEQRAQSLPIDPQTRELRDQLPADPRGVERRLGLREARGPVTDLRGHNASSREIVDALRPR